MNPETLHFLRQASMTAVAGLAVGGAIELFMIKTGFYQQVVNKEAERRAQAESEREARKAARAQREKSQ